MMKKKAASRIRLQIIRLKYNFIGVKHRFLYNHYTKIIHF